jgi:uncharacterized membrane protein
VTISERAEAEPAAPARLPDEPTRPTSRLVGVDLARGLAVLGMFGAHLGWVSYPSAEPRTWLGLVYGRPSVLFALLAGVSLALLTGRTRPATGEDRVGARVRILVRAVWIFAIGGVLESLGTFVAVILGVYGVLFVLTLPFLGWTSRRLFALAGLLAVTAPFADLLLRQLVRNVETGDRPFSYLMLTGPYPALIWWTFVLVGLGIGRLDLTAIRVRAGLFGTSLILMLVGYGAGWVTAKMETGGQPTDGLAGGEYELGTWDWAWFSGATPHSGTTFEILGSTGFAIAVLVLSLVLADLHPWLAYPAASVGMMALTVYSVHIVAIWVWVDKDAISSDDTWHTFMLVALVLATLWRVTLGRGPLERLLTWSSVRAASPGRAAVAEPKNTDLERM